MPADPPTPLPVRASDLERERTARTLRERAAQGHISIDTFARRLDLLHEARSRQQLDDLVRDLPPANPLARALERWTAAGSALARRIEVAWRRPRVPPLVLPPDRDTLTIGRSRGSDYRIEDEFVSRRHATLRRTAAGWVIEDDSSLNGTRVNGIRVQTRSPLRAGDLITVGRVHLRAS